MREAEFLAGVFFDFELPQDKMFLFKYFRSDLEKQFLRYYFCFYEIEHFSNHTGFYCQNRWTRILEKRVRLLIKCHEYYKKNFELENLAKVEMGKIKFGDIKCFGI